MVHPCSAGARTGVEGVVRTLGSVTELYVRASLGRGDGTAEQVRQILSAAAALLREHAAVPVQERVFAPPPMRQLIAGARQAALGDIDDGVEPAWLAAPDDGAAAGVQIHAVAGCGRPRVLAVDGVPCGRLVSSGDGCWLFGSNIRAPGEGPPAAQAAGMFWRAEALLRQAGGSLHHVARTWLWLGGILDWYGELNRVRNELFKSRGLLAADGTGQLPASTGIGVRPFGSARCAMDLVAVLAGERPKFLLRGGRQGAASAYGSAFSRAAVVPTPAGRAIYVSGTAAIDAAGRTTHVGDIGGQIEATLDNMHAALADAGGRPEQIVQSIAYCKTPQVQAAFEAKWADRLPRCLVVQADVCRPELLFEVEATAMER